VLLYWSDSDDKHVRGCVVVDSDATRPAADLTQRLLDSDAAAPAVTRNGGGRSTPVPRANHVNLYTPRRHRALLPSVPTGCRFPGHAARMAALGRSFAAVAVTFCLQGLKRLVMGDRI